jgi:hypothetical protein
LVLENAKNTLGVLIRSWDHANELRRLHTAVVVAVTCCQQNRMYFHASTICIYVICSAV